MKEQAIHLEDLESLKTYLQDKKKTSIMIGYRHCEGYPGMVLGLMIVLDQKEGSYDLDLQWMSFGLDVYGDTLQESYVYRFDDLGQLMAYLQSTYGIQISDIRIPFHVDQAQFPSPLTHADQKAVFESAWERFQIDFRNGEFLDPDLNLVYNSENH